MTVSITGAQVEDNTVSECICIVDVMRGYKLLQLSKFEESEYGYEASEYGNEAKCECLPPRIPVYAT